MTHRAVLITGSNLGDRRQLLDTARGLLHDRAGKVVKISGIYESEPWGDMDEGTCGFLNQVLVVETGLDPEALLDVTQEIERGLGRTVKGEASGQGRKYESRTIDIDILYYDDAVIRTERLEVPHPLIAQREFVLIPLAEVLPGHKNPVNCKTPGEMLDDLKGKI